MRCQSVGSLFDRFVVSSVDNVLVMSPCSSDFFEFDGEYIFILFHQLSDLFFLLRSKLLSKVVGVLFAREILVLDVHRLLDVLAHGIDSSGSYSSSSTVRGGKVVYFLQGLVHDRVEFN